MTEIIKYNREYMDENYSLMKDKKTNPSFLGLLQKLWRNLHRFLYGPQSNAFVNEGEEVNNTLLVAEKC